jgi:hypothetical protein
LDAGRSFFSAVLNAPPRREPLPLDVRAFAMFFFAAVFCLVVDMAPPESQFREVTTPSTTEPFGQPSTDAP